MLLPLLFVAYAHQVSPVRMIAGSGKSVMSEGKEGSLRLCLILRTPSAYPMRHNNALMRVEKLDIIAAMRKEKTKRTEGETLPHLNDSLLYSAAQKLAAQRMYQDYQQ